jgi:hypothetical protein
VSSSNDLEANHHRVVFVHDVVAVHHVLPYEVAELHENLDFVTWTETRHVLAPAFLQQWWTAIP